MLLFLKGVRNAFSVIGVDVAKCEVAMNKVLFAVTMLFSVGVFADSTGPCFGPAGCTEDPTISYGPSQLCLSAELGCATVYYSQLGAADGSGAWFAVAQSTIRGYSVLGSAGPCLVSEVCSNIYQQAYDALRTNALMANRAMRFISSD